MKEVNKEKNCDPDCGMDECCIIAQSMIEEIHQIALPGFAMRSHGKRRHKGSLKQKLLSQIKAARKVAMM